MDINIVKLKEYAKDCSMLYVEDDELIRTQTASFLGRFFSNLDLAKDGAEGLQKYKDRPYDIVVSDINMPNMNGIDMITNIRELNADQIVLVTSAYNDSDNLINLINLSVTRFVLKPFNNKQFLSMIYQIAEELFLKKIYAKSQQQALEAQKIVDMIDSGILVIVDNSIVTANKAFLKIVGFEDFKAFKIEMPEVGVLFEENEDCINAQTNSEFIKEVQTSQKQNPKVCINRNNKLFEYKVDITKVGDKEHYILVFTDISNVKNVLNCDDHTGLPIKKAVLDYIESLKLTTNNIKTVLIIIKNYNHVIQWYGKTDSIRVEAEASEILKNILIESAPNAFLGYFAENKFILVLNEHSYIEIKEELRRSIFPYNQKLTEAHKDAQIDYYLSLKPEFIELDTNTDRQTLEINIMDGFENMEV